MANDPTEDSPPRDLDRELKELEIRAKKQDLEAQRLEIEAKKKEPGATNNWTTLWNSPVALAVIAALVGYLGTLLSSFLAGRSEQARHEQSLALETVKQSATEKLESGKLQGNLILEAVKTGEGPETAQRAAANLLLLADASLVTFNDTALEKLRSRAGNAAPGLPSPVPSAGPEMDEQAYVKMRADAAYAVYVLNELFGKALQTPPVKPTDGGWGPLNAYFDPNSNTIYAPPAVQHIPDMMYRQVSHMYQPSWDFEGQTGALANSIADCLAAVVKQRRMKQTAETADWLLYQKGVAWLREEDLSRSSDTRPLRSFKTPGAAYDDPTVGKDPQVGHMADYVQEDQVTRADTYANAGIPSKAFYETAMALGTDKATAIWIAAISKIEGPRPSFGMFATETAGQAAGAHGPEARAAVVEAWKKVGVETVE